MTTPRPIDDATLLAFLDGELDLARTAEVELALAEDASLAQRLERHRALGARLTAAFAPVLSDPVPEAVLRAARAPAPVTDLAAFRAKRTVTAARPAWLQGGRLGLIAASVLAVVVVSQAFLTPSPSPIVEQGGHLLASGPLAHALDVQLASAGEVKAVRVNLTFRDHDGNICRTFQDRATAGVACRMGTRWAIQAVVSGAGSASDNRNDYRMASSGDPRLMQVVSDMVEGEAFDAAQERQAKARDWTPGPRLGPARTGDN